MAEKRIRIHIGVGADVDRIRAVNSELAKMAMAVGRGNEAMRQSTMRAAREYGSLGDAADRAAGRAVLSAREIEAAWRKAMAKPVEEAGRGFSALAQAAKGAARGIGGAFGGVFGMFLQGGIWGAAAQAVTKTITWAWTKMREGAEREAKRAERAWKDGLEAIRDGAAALEASFSSSMSALDRGVSRFDAMTSSVRELTKAEIELARQRAIANGMEPARADAAASDLSAKVDEEAEERRLKNVIETERKRIAVAKEAEAKTAEEVRRASKAKADAEAEYARKREEYARRNAKTTRLELVGLAKNGGGGWRVVSLSDKEVAENMAAARAAFEETDEAREQRERVKGAADALKSIKTDERALAAAEDARAKIEQAENALDALAVRSAARDLAKENARAAKAEEEAKREAEVRAEADRKAAAERDRLDRELHQRRMADLREEIAAQSKAAGPLKAVAAAAQGEFERQFALYRDPRAAAAAVGEEKARAEDLDRLHADAARYGGKWRIDELSRLMAAGDAQGQADALASWRRSSRFAPEVEAMVRASAAERTKTTAEDELRKISANTAGLAAKLDELISAK